MTTSPLQGSGPVDAVDDDAAAPPGGWINPRGGHLFFLGFAAIGAGMADLTPAVLTLPLKAGLIDERNSTAVLSLAIGIASLASIIAFPAFGRLSDRTVGGIGRRRPFLLLGAILIVIGAVLLVAATDVALLVLAGVFTLVGFSATMVVTTATLADQFAPDRRGTASALVGLSLPVGAVIGLFIAQLVAPNFALMVLLPAELGALGSVLFAVRLRDRRITAAERPAFDLASFFGTYWVNPRRAPSFAWAWWSRLLLFFGVAALQAYQALYLIFVLHFTGRTVAGAVFLTTLALTVTALVFAPIAGRVSDRIGRRKPFVIGSAIVFAVGLVVAASAQSFGAFVVASIIVGFGQGIYFAVDIALVTQVLPDPDDAGKDLGIMSLASTLPSALVPAVAPAIVAIGASATLPQNFSALFIAGAVVATIGALLILPIRGAR